MFCTDAREILRLAEGQESWCLIGNMICEESLRGLWSPGSCATLYFFFSALKRASPHRQSGMLATLKRNVGELFRSELSSLPLALLCTTFYRCSDIQLVNAEIWAKIQRTQSQFAQHLCQHFLIQQAPLLTNRVWCQFLSSHGIDKSRTRHFYRIQG